MHTIRLNIKDGYFSRFLSLLKALPMDQIEVINEDELDQDTLAYIQTDAFEKDRIYLHKSLEEIESGEAQLVSHDEVWDEIEKHSNNK